MELNFNNKVVIYPNELGFEKMTQILAENWGMSFDESWKYIQTKLTKNGGFEYQLWDIMNKFGSMFYNGQRYFKTMNFDYIE